MARGGEGVGGGRPFESINITRNGKVINMDGDEMVRQNENDVRCTGGNLITRPPPRAIHADGRGKALSFSSREGKSDLLHLAVVVAGV